MRDKTMVMGIVLILIAIIVVTQFKERNMPDWGDSTGNNGNHDATPQPSEEEPEPEPVYTMGVGSTWIYEITQNITGYEETKYLKLVVTVYTGSHVTYVTYENATGEWSGGSQTTIDFTNYTTLTPSFYVVQKNLEVGDKIQGGYVIDRKETATYFGESHELNVFELNSTTYDVYTINKYDKPTGILFYTYDSSGGYYMQQKIISLQLTKQYL